MNLLNRLIQLSNEKQLFEINATKYFAQMSPGLGKVYSAIVADPALVFETIQVVEEVVAKSRALANKWSQSAAAQELQKFANEMATEIAPNCELNKQLERIFKDAQPESHENGITPLSPSVDVMLEVRREDYRHARAEMVNSIDLAKKELSDSKNFSFKKYWVERAEQHLETYDLQTLNRLNASDFQCITEKAKSLTQKIDTSMQPW
jgi:hypothetical protein